MTEDLEALKATVKELERNIAELQDSLIESEHRWPVIIRTWVKSWNWSKGGSRRRAAWLAFLWRVFTPTTVAMTVGGGGLLLGGYTAYLFDNQNRLVAAQTKEMVAQNKALADANELTTEQFRIENQRKTRQRRSELIGVLWDTWEAKTGGAPSSPGSKRAVPMASAVHRREASIEYVMTLEGLDEPVNLSGARLDGVLSTEKWSATVKTALDGAILTRANLSLAELEGASLIGAVLNATQLVGADLTGADLRSAILSDAILKKANLEKANLSDAMLSGADLRGANLRGAILSGADLSGAKLTGATLTDAVWDEEPTWPTGFTAQPSARPRLDPKVEPSQEELPPQPPPKDTDTGS